MGGYIMGVPSAVEQTTAAQFEGRLFSFSFAHNTNTGFQEFKLGSQPKLTFHDGGHTANHLISWRTTVAKAKELASSIFTANTRYGQEIGVPAWAILGAIPDADVIYADSSATEDGKEYGIQTSTCPQGAGRSTALQTCDLSKYTTEHTTTDQTVILSMVACEPHVWKNHIGIAAYVP